MNLKKILLKFGILIKLVLLACWLLSNLQTVGAQRYEGAPTTKQGIIKALASKQFQTREIVQRINARGVDFELTPGVQSELVAAGARPEIIAAVRGNFRAPAVVKPMPVSTGKTKLGGAPLGKEAIITLLENGVADAQVRKNVQARGVSFKATPQAKTEIKTAGGSVALINLIALSYVAPDENPADAGSNTVATSAADKYDGLIDKAVDLYDNKQDKQGALNSLQEAVKLDVNNSRAYQLLGFMNLYGMSNYAEAERNMKESLNRGGSAVLRVFHDHDGFFQETCKGSLYVAKDTVRFESDDNAHTFQTADSDIQKIKTNSAFKRAFQTKQGSFQIVLKSGDSKGVKFSFAPLTDNIAESKMIIRLIGKNE
ncbi:MAG TPA: hypothetical protein VNI84_00355 [Pyrinomonadaceae bacterium]|nr:hypothetical protein [Pyrinomonadaceae bacterium]